MLRGGRLNVLRYKLQHPSEIFLPRSRSGSRSRTNSIPRTPTQGQSSQLGTGTPAPPTPESRRSTARRRGRSRSNSAFGPAAAMAGIVAGSIGGWSPIERRDGDGNIFNNAPLHEQHDLESRAGVEVHPGTNSNDLGNGETSSNNFLRPPSQLAAATPSLGRQRADSARKAAEAIPSSSSQLTPSNPTGTQENPTRSHKAHASA